MQRLPMFVTTADGTQLFTRDWGRGHAVVFVTSWGVTAELWHGQLDHLVEHGCRCVAFDRRGHGRSSLPDGYELDALADDLARVIDASGLERITLISHSMGACELVRYLSRHGTERIARVALVAPTTPGIDAIAAEQPEVAAAVRAQIEANIARWRSDLSGWVEDNVDPFLAPDTPRSVRDWAVAMMRPLSPRVAIACQRAGAYVDLRAELRAIDVPALVIHGTRDASAPLALTGAPTAQLIPHAELRVYDEAPHGLMFTHAARLNRDLRDFIA